MSCYLHEIAVNGIYSVGTSRVVKANRLAATFELQLGNAPIPPALQHALRDRVLDVRAAVELITRCLDPHAAAVVVEGLGMEFFAQAFLTRLRASTNDELSGRLAREAAAARSLSDFLRRVPPDAIDRHDVCTWLQDRGGAREERLARLRSARSFAVFCEHEFKVRALARACDDARAFQSAWCGARFAVVTG